MGKILLLSDILYPTAKGFEYRLSKRAAKEYAGLLVVSPRFARFLSVTILSDTDENVNNYEFLVPTLRGIFLSFLKNAPLRIRIRRVNNRWKVCLDKQLKPLEEKQVKRIKDLLNSNKIWEFTINEHALSLLFLLCVHYVLTADQDICLFVMRILQSRLSDPLLRFPEFHQRIWNFLTQLSSQQSLLNPFFWTKVMIDDQSKLSSDL